MDECRFWTLFCAEFFWDEEPKKTRVKDLKHLYFELVESESEAILAYDLYCSTQGAAINLKSFQTHSKVGMLSVRHRMNRFLSILPRHSADYQEMVNLINECNIDMEKYLNKQSE